MSEVTIEQAMDTVGAPELVPLIKFCHELEKEYVFVHVRQVRKLLLDNGERVASKPLKSASCKDNEAILEYYLTRYFKMTAKKDRDMLRPYFGRDVRKEKDAIYQELLHKHHLTQVKVSTLANAALKLKKRLDKSSQLSTIEKIALIDINAVIVTLSFHENFIESHGLCRECRKVFKRKVPNQIFCNSTCTDDAENRYKREKRLKSKGIPLE